MNEFDNADLIRHVLGDAPHELARAIEEAARNDPELTAKLEVMGWAAGDVASPPSAPSQPRRAAARIGHYPLLKGILVHGAVFGAGVGLGLGMFSVLFHSQQSPVPQREQPPSGAQEHTKLEIARGTVRLEKDYFCLLNRGSLLTVEEFPAPFEVRFDWRWLDRPGDSDYPENLHVILHTEGKHKPTHNFRMADGIEITLMSANGFIGIVADSFHPLGQTAEHVVDLSEGAWHTVRIVDDGKAISVFVHRKGEASGKALLTTAYQRKFQKHHVAVFNRELIAGRPHETHIANFTVRPLQKENGAAD